MTHPFFPARPPMVGFALTLFVALAGCGAASGLTDPGDGGDVVLGSDQVLPPRLDVAPPPIDVPVTGSCASNADCGAGMYCAGDACGTPGTCMPAPRTCPPGPPVCGCDGRTYPNPCGAVVSGARIASDGPCEGADVMPPPDDRIAVGCLQRGDCAGSEYCAQMACGAPGSCVPRPDDCGPGGTPVCSCDGATFRNECFAHLVGESVAFAGTCGRPGADGGPPPPFDGGPPPGCRSNAECPATELCEQTSCGGAGFCVPRMVPCTPGAVCGCDGRTYMSACVPFGLGVSIAHLGACEGPVTDGGPPPFDSGPSGCRSNSDCAPTDTCQGMACFGPGECFTRSIPCVGGAVCGCDGVTYAQACGALARGVRIASLAPCATSGDGGVPPADVVRPGDAAAVDASAGGCFSNAECRPGAFCYASGCGTVGRCIAEPPMCPPIVSPVCGCDGVTYDSFCAAFQNGQRFAHAGACGPTGLDGGGFPGDGGGF